MHESIPKYAFNNRTNPRLGFEIIPFERIIEKAKEQAKEPHRLNFNQIFFVTEGKGTVQIDFREVDYQVGSVIPIAKGQVQNFELSDETKGFSLLFTSEFLIKDVESYKYLYDFVIFNHSIEPIAFEINDETQNIINILKEEQQNHLAFHQLEYTQNLIKSVLICLERIKRNQTDIVCEDSLDLYQLFRAKLDKNLSYKLKVADFCEELGTTSKKLNAAIKLYSGSSAKEAIDERIVLECKRLLSYSPLSIKEIAYEIGFEDPTNFTKYFKKHAEILPLEFRNKK